MRLLNRKPRLRALRRAELRALADRVPYYRSRITYMTAAGDVIEDLIDRHHASRALELGPHLRPLVVGADVMEREARDDIETEGRTIVHDATVVPWPIPDRAYDLFVALQVFEHLGTSQAEAFLEVRRVAKHAVLSLPIDWQLRDPTDIHHQIPHERVLSWFAPVKPTIVVLGNASPGMRLIYVFEHLPKPAD
jgi:hypothetical protein